MLRQREIDRDREREEGERDSEKGSETERGREGNNIQAYVFKLIVLYTFIILFNLCGEENEDWKLLHALKYLLCRMETFCIVIIFT